MTTPTRAGLRILDGKATPGPLILIKYEHGGGRLYKEEPRQLIADFFDAENREVFVAARNALPGLLDELDTKDAELREYIEHLRIRRDIARMDCADDEVDLIEAKMRRLTDLLIPAR